MSAVTRTATIVSVSLATMMATNVGASLNIVRRLFIVIQAVGFATPMETGVITSTLAGNGIRIGSTTTATATDKPGTPSIALGPAGGGAQLSDPARTRLRLSQPVVGVGIAREYLVDETHGRVTRAWRPIACKC